MGNSGAGGGGGGGGSGPNTRAGTHRLIWPLASQHSETKAGLLVPFDEHVQVLGVESWGRGRSGGGGGGGGGRWREMSEGIES